MFLGIGIIVLQGVMYEDGFIDDEEVIDLQCQGVIGEMICYVFDIDGVMLFLLLVVCVIMLLLVQVLQWLVIVFFGGSKKVDVVCVVLCGGWFIGLVIDEICVCYVL